MPPELMLPHYFVAQEGMKCIERGGANAIKGACNTVYEHIKYVLLLSRSTSYVPFPQIQLTMRHYPVPPNACAFFSPTGKGKPQLHGNGILRIVCILSSNSKPKGPPLTEVQKRARSLCETASAHVGLMATPIWMRADVWRTLPGTVMGAGR